jgi:hypothetical protein
MTKPTQSEKQNQPVVSQKDLFAFNVLPNWSTHHQVEKKGTSSGISHSTTRLPNPWIASMQTIKQISTISDQSFSYVSLKNLLLYWCFQKASCHRSRIHCRARNYDDDRATERLPFLLVNTLALNSQNQHEKHNIFHYIVISFYTPKFFQTILPYVSNPLSACHHGRPQSTAHGEHWESIFTNKNFTVQKYANSRNESHRL